MGGICWRKAIAVGMVFVLAAAIVAWSAEKAAPQFQEKEGAPVVRKHKKFPWLPVILGVGAGVVLVLLLTKKKEQTLAVNLKIGTKGTPAATAKYKRGTTVSYDYLPRDHFNSLQVRLDGAVVPPSGTVTMNANHILDVSATEFFILTVNLGPGTGGTPSVSASFGRDQVVNYSYRALADTGSLQVRLDNVVVTASGSVTMVRDHTLSASISESMPTFSNGVLTINGIRYELAWVPPGEFLMGSNSPDAESDEQPVHPVLISKPFWFGKTEVTQELWQAVMGNNPSKFPYGGNYPVEDALWTRCQDFIQSLNQMLGGNSFRLPTEAEWEYACRAGSTDERYGELDAIAWYVDNSGGQTHPVGQKQPNAFGLYDMLGNVWEWCQDIYDFPYQPGYQIDPTGIEPGLGRTGRVYRGGSWETRAAGVRAANRDRNHPNYNPKPAVSVGFRLARTNE